MKVHVEKPRPCQRVLEIEVPAGRVKEEFNSLCAKYRQGVEMPGFRRGKVPLSIIRAQFRPAIERDVLESLLPKAFQEAVNQEKLSPISPPEVSDVEFFPEKLLRFRASVEVRPEVRIGNYRGLRLTKKVRTVSDEDLSSALEDLRRRHAQFQPVERAAKLGDFLVIDWQRQDGTGPGEGASGVLVELGSGNMPEDLQGELVGATPGEEKSVWLPPRSEGDIQGQGSRYTVKVREVKERTLPELNDDFAREVGEYQSVDQLKEAMMKLLTDNANHEAERRLKTEIINQLIERNPIEVPESMVAHYVNSALKQLRREQGGTIDEEEMKRRCRESAIWQIKRSFLLDEIGKEEGIEVTQEEIDQIMEKGAPRNLREGTPPNPRLRDQLSQKKGEIRERKVLDFLLEQAEVEVQSDEK